MKYKENALSYRDKLSEDIVQSHVEFLKEKFYKIKTHWPQFKILFDEINEISNKIGEDESILILERAYFYGGWTLFAPIFHKHKVTAVDCVTSNDDKRWGAQESWLDEDRCIKWRPDFVNAISDLKDIKSESVDYLIVPNVIHHEKYQTKMFLEFSRVLKKGGKCLIFEGLVREIHHLPNDYVRYTHEGLKVMFEQNGLKFDSFKNGSGVFDVIAYAWQNAFEYLPENLRKEKIKWFYSEHFPYLKELDQKYNKNILKPDKSFPMSFIVWAHKD